MRLPTKSLAVYKKVVGILIPTATLPALITLLTETFQIVTAALQCGRGDETVQTGSVGNNFTTS